MSKFRKMSPEALEKEYDKVDKLHNEIILHSRYKNCEKLVVIPKEMQKFKKYPPVTINYVYNEWIEDFVDEDTGEVVSITRYEQKGLFHEGKFYNFYNVVYDSTQKKYVVDYVGAPDEVMPLYIDPKQLKELNYVK